MVGGQEHVSIFVVVDGDGDGAFEGGGVGIVFVD